LPEFTQQLDIRVCGHYGLLFGIVGAV